MIRQNRSSPHAAQRIENPKATLQSQRNPFRRFLLSNQFLTLKNAHHFLSYGIGHTIHHILANATQQGKPHELFRLVRKE
jgi:hypothetical protein